MDVNNMITALSAKTVDVMVNVEPYNAIAEADGLAVKIMNYWDVDKMPVFMAATPDFVDKSPDAVVAYLKAWLEVARDFKDSPAKVADAIYAFYTSKGYTMSQDTFRKAMTYVDVEPGFPGDLKPYMQEQAEILLKEKKIAAIPDWSQGAAPGLHGEGDARGRDKISPLRCVMRRACPGDPYGGTIRRRKQGRQWMPARPGMT